MNVRKISDALRQKAEDELNEDESRVQDDLTYIKNWLKKQSYITARTDDQWLISFLRGSKFSLERTKEKLDMYHTIKTITPEMFENRDPLLPEMQDLLKLGQFLPLRKLESPTSPRVILLRNGIYDPVKHPFSNVTKISTMIQDIMMMEDDNFIISGMIVLHDMKGVGMNHLANLPPSLVKKSLVAFQQAYPNRIKGMYFINNPSIFGAIFNLIRPFLTAKLKKRVCVYSDDNLSQIYDNIPKEILPEEYGGQGGKIQDLIDYWKEKVEKNRQWFLEDAKYKTNEKKRPKGPKTVDSVFGLDGTFRKLSVD